MRAPLETIRQDATAFAADQAERPWPFPDRAAPIPNNRRRALRRVADQVRILKVLRTAWVKISRALSCHFSIDSLCSDRVFTWLGTKSV